MAQDGVPCLGNPLAADEQLEAVLARVSGAGDEGVDPGHVAVPESKVGDRIESVARQQLLRAWSLKGNQPELERAVLDLHVARRVLAKPPEVGLAVGRVHDNEITLVASVHDEVVHDSAGLVAEKVVLRLALAKHCQVVGDEVLQKLQARVAGDPEAPHVRDVEEAGDSAHREMLVADGAVLLRHLPTAEIHHPRTQCDVAFVERCASQGAIRRQPCRLNRWRRGR